MIQRVASLFVSTTILVAGGCVEAEQPAPMAPTAAALQAPPPPAAPVAAPAPVAAKEVPISSKSPAAVEAFKKARDLVDNARGAEAVELLAQAIQLDADFASAHAMLGAVTPGPEGMAHIEKALTLAKSIPESERLVIEALHASRRGDQAASIELQRKLLTLAPGDVRVLTHLGGALMVQRRYDEASATLRRAVELDPRAGPAYNLLGYSSANQGKHDEAIAAFKKYAELYPAEPNPHDSLAEAYLMAGRFEESEAAFKKALEISPKFSLAWQGIAQTRFMRGDYKAGREAAAKYKEAALRPFDRLDADQIVAWSKLYEGKHGEAAKAFEATGKAAAEQKEQLQEALAGIGRAFTSLDSGKAADAVKHVDAALELADKANLPGDGLLFVKRWGLSTRLLAQTKLAKPAEVQKTAAQVEQLAKQGAGDAELQSTATFARGMVAWSSGDAKAAVAQMAQCLPDDALCRWQLALAQEKAGDKPGAEATRAALIATPRRDPVSAFVRAKVGGIPSAKAGAGKAPSDKAAPAKSDKPSASKDPAAAPKTGDKAAVAAPAAKPAAKPSDQPAASKKP